MGKNSQKKFSAVPDNPLPLTAPSYQGVQVNYCKIPTCTACGISADESLIRKKGRGATEPKDLNYTAQRVSSGLPGMRCRHCGASITLKSNKGVYEEYQRIRQYLVPKEKIGCPNSDCENHARDLNDPLAFALFGKTAAGSQRYKCRVCTKVFSNKPSLGSKQRKTSNNGVIFELLCNSMPMRRICHVLKIAPKTLYDRIRFIAQKCDEFSAHREQKLLDGALKLPRLSISSDMQVYVSNWPDKDDKRRIDLYAMGSADNKSGYVLAMTLNYDKSIQADDAEDELVKNGELATPAAFRDYARIWLPIEFEKAEHHHPGMSAHARSPKDSAGEVAMRYLESGERISIDMPEVLDPKEFQLPHFGSRTKTDYMAIGHMMHLADLVRHIPRVNLYMDQDSVFYAAAYAAFLDRFKAGSADAFYVAIRKGASDPERRAAFRSAQKRLKKEQEDSGCNERDAALNLIREEMAKAVAVGPFNDRWVLHPLPNKADTDKRMCHLTAFPGRSQRRLEWQFLFATLHGLDRFFNNVRRSLSPMERAIHSASTDGRTWNQKSNYNPEYAELLLKIYRTYYNYCHVPLESRDKMTPAQRIGLAKAPLRTHDILYFDPEKS